MNGMTPRHLHRIGRTATAWLLCLPAASVAAQGSRAPEPAAVRAAFAERTADRTFRGLAAAWRDGDSIRFATAGVSGPGGTLMSPGIRVPLGEAGALLTAALFANLVAAGELAFDQPAQPLLPEPIRLPIRNGRSITLGDLALHRAGLPNQPPTTGGTVRQRLANAVNGVTLAGDIGSRYAYSQLGIDLLGAALATQLRMPLDAAVEARILKPLGLAGIRFSSGGSRAGEDASGHARDGTPLPLGPLPEGRWHASVSRLAQLAVAASDTVDGPLASTFALMMRTRSLGADPTLPVALGWRVLRLDGRDIYWHDALDVPGFALYLAIDPARQRMATVVSNTARPVDAIAGQILLGRVPRIAADPPRRLADTPRRPNRTARPRPARSTPRSRRPR
ncbi:MAG: beta-lactamase family protein [Gemmatimonadaceae bacterium]|nr:beta-lactamase family protein [Gemmatimonadaceae bacterium]